MGRPCSCAWQRAAGIEDIVGIGSAGGELGTGASGDLLGAAVGHREGGGVDRTGRGAGDPPPRDAAALLDHGGAGSCSGGAYRGHGTADRLLRFAAGRPLHAPRKHQGDAQGGAAGSDDLRRSCLLRPAGAGAGAGDRPAGDDPADGAPLPAGADHADLYRDAALLLAVAGAAVVRWGLFRRL